MKRLIVMSAMGLAALSMQAVSYAAVDAKLAQSAAKEHGCLGCHDIDKKKIGPAYKDVSAKFKGKSLQDVTGAMKASAVPSLMRVMSAKILVFSKILLLSTTCLMRIFGRWVAINCNRPIACCLL